MRRLALGLVLLSGSVARATVPVPELPGWSLSSTTQAAFTVGRDTAVHHGGQASARLASTDAQAGWAMIAQTIRADAFAGRRVRLSAYVRVADVKQLAGLIFMVNQDGRPVAVDKMQGRGLRGTGDWRRYESVLAVPRGAAELRFGLWQSGSGTSWIDDVRLEVVDSRVPTTDELLMPSAPQNVGLEEADDGEPRGWFLSGGARAAYAATLVTQPVHGGRRAALLAPKEAAPRGYATLMQELSAERYRGQRVRVSAWVKSEGVTVRGDLWGRSQGPLSPGDGLGMSGASAAGLEVT